MWSDKLVLSISHIFQIAVEKWGMRTRKKARTGEERVGGGSIARRRSGGGETMLLIRSVSCGGGGREAEGEVGGSGSSVDDAEASAFSTGKWDAVFRQQLPTHLPSTLLHMHPRACSPMRILPVGDRKCHSSRVITIQGICGQSRHARSC